MGKIITVQRKENEGQLAENYIRTYILFPSGLLGLLAMIIGILALVYQLFFETYDEWTFIKSSGLMLAGILLGWGQTRYHRYLFRAFPEFWASRMKSSNSAGRATIQENQSSGGSGVAACRPEFGAGGLLVGDRVFDSGFRCGASVPVPWTIWQRLLCRGRDFFGASCLPGGRSFLL